MQQGIHPKLAEVTITCSCGAQYASRSTIGRNFHVEICANCHPFFTGGQARLIDAAGSIEKFNRRFRGQGAAAPAKKAANKK